jgi:hypothetical protein
MRNMQAIKVFLTFSLLTLFASCGKKKLEPAGYIHWIKNYENGLHKKKQVGEYVFDVQLKPLDYIMLTERNKKDENSNEFKEELEEMKGMDYFSLKISLAENREDFLKYKSNGEKHYYNRLYYYSFGFSEDIYLESEEGTKPCKLFHFERSYDLTNARTFVLGFENTSKKKPSGDLTLVIDSKDLGLGPVKIKFDQKNLNSIPQLKNKKNVQS